MTGMAFDTLRYARRLRDAGVPEPQAEVQAELMAEAFGNNLLTVDRFADVLNARFAEQRAVFEQHVHTGMLGAIMVVLVLSRLHAWIWPVLQS